MNRIVPVRRIVAGQAKGGAGIVANEELAVLIIVRIVAGCRALKLLVLIQAHWSGAEDGGDPADCPLTAAQPPES